LKEKHEEKEEWLWVFPFSSDGRSGIAFSDDCGARRCFISSSNETLLIYYHQVCSLSLSLLPG